MIYNGKTILPMAYPLGVGDVFTISDIGYSLLRKEDKIQFKTLFETNKCIFYVYKLHLFKRDYIDTKNKVVSKLKFNPYCKKSLIQFGNFKKKHFFTTRIVQIEITELRG